MDRAQETRPDKAQDLLSSCPVFGISDSGHPNSLRQYKLEHIRQQSKLFTNYRYCSEVRCH